MDRRTTLKWVLAAAGSLSGSQAFVPLWAAQGADARHEASKRPPPPEIPDLPTATGYGTDPDLTQVYKLGEFWPLTLTPVQRNTARVLCDLIIPADASSPSASEVGVVDFIDEWISAPYEAQRKDRVQVLEGLAWLDTAANTRFGAGSAFTTLTEVQQTAICDDICLVEKAKPELLKAARFFARYRDLTAGGFYTTPQGREDLKYVGNVPMTHFDGPPPEVLKKVGLA